MRRSPVLAIVVAVGGAAAGCARPRIAPDPVPAVTGYDVPPATATTATTTGQSGAAPTTAMDTTRGSFDATRAATGATGTPSQSAGTLGEARAGLRADRRLDAIARVAAEAASRGYIVSTARLRAATVASLGSDVLPYVITARGDERATEAQLAGALADLRAAAALEAVGVGEATGVTGRVVALVATPVPTVAVAATRRGDEVTLELAWPWPASPAAYLTTPDRTRKVVVAQAGDVVRVLVRCRGGEAGGFATDAAIEIDAGLRTVASVPSVCGGRRTEDTALDVGPPARTAVEIEERLFALVNQTRVDLGRSPLAWDATAQRMARDHAADMARGGFIGHVGSGGATLTDRVLGHALAAVETFENVGKAGGPGQAHAAFLASPGHRANLLAAGARRGAIGVVLDPRTPGDFYVAEVFFEPTR